MIYNDFLLPQNFEKVAKAYHSALQNKGFVFVRLDDVGMQKTNILKELDGLFFGAFKQFEKSKKFAKGKSLIDLLEKLIKITPQQHNEILQIYNILPTQKNTKTQEPTFINLISSEGKLLKMLFALLQNEDDENKNLFLKSIIEKRLEILSGN